MFGLDNPIVQGLIVDLIFTGIKIGGKELFSNNLSQQLQQSIETTFDKLSERYPVKKTIEGLTFWDYVSRKITEEIKNDDVEEENLNNILKSILNELLTDTNELEDMINKFWILFKGEIILHTELYNYLLMSSQQEVKKGLFGLYDKIEDLFTTLQNGEKKNIEGLNEELINYIIAIQQTFINELEYDFIDRKFNFDNELPSVELKDILEEKRDILILGEPGSGKSFIAKKILYELTETSEESLLNKIPVFLNLSVYGYKFKTISDGILQLLQKYIDGIDIDHIHKYIKDGSFIIILDGLCNHSFSMSENKWFFIIFFGGGLVKRLSFAEYYSNDNQKRCRKKGQKKRETPIGSPPSLSPLYTYGFRHFYNNELGNKCQKLHPTF